ncbi:BrnA antitoxin family protein [Sediminimonas qiaohouensis]|uniref:BrnA antitoxin family protein n=2 Tax=Sediminimonas TaxID=659427 RepID=UPI00040FB215|nr:BrnA antitoxin family protein [Sediminimonas qiaohouensis]MDR9486349.1 BrnA antitoxin family protein [Sediminimonas sp.]
MARMTKTERIARDRLMKDLIHLSRDGWIDTTLAEEVPDAWHTLEADLDVEEPREKVTLYLDRSVVRFYRGMGRGYHARINRLLRTWAQMKIAGEVQLDAYLEKRMSGGEDEAEGEEKETPES